MLIRLKTIDKYIVAIETSYITAMYPAVFHSEGTTIRLSDGCQIHFPEGLDYYFNLIRDLDKKGTYDLDAGLDVY